MVRWARWFGVVGLLAAAGLGLGGILTAEQTSAFGVVVVFLAATNFGRSCPLIMSLRWWIRRLRTDRSAGGSEPDR
jgi:hypothetical protein